jgi:transcriptional regulator with XRE-family HTH domain
MPEVQYSPTRLQDLMDRRNMSNTELAQKSGVTLSMIDYLRTGKRKTASAAVMARLADTLETTVSYLLGMGDEGRVTIIVPEAVRRLAEIACRLSEMRQEELVRIAAALEQLERELGAPSEVLHK